MPPHPPTTIHRTATTLRPQRTAQEDAAMPPSRPLPLSPPWATLMSPLSPDRIGTKGLPPPSTYLAPERSRKRGDAALAHRSESKS